MTAVSAKASSLQDLVRIDNYPIAFKISMCVNASYMSDSFTSPKYKSAGKWRMKMFRKLGAGRYAPRGKYVLANYNVYVASQGKERAAKMVWNMNNCKDHL